jgi:hypothetical protein
MAQNIWLSSKVRYVSCTQKSHVHLLQLTLEDISLLNLTTIINDVHVLVGLFYHYR